MASSTKKVTGSSTTYDSGSYTKQTWTETSAAGQNNYAVQDDATSAKLSLTGSGDKIYIEGVAGEYQVKASGKTVTLKSDSGQVITIVLNSASKSAVVTDTVYFLDGSLTLGNSSGTATIKFGDQTLGKTFKYLTADLTDSSAGADYFDGAASGSTTDLAAGVARVTGTDGNDTFNGSMTNSGATLDSGDVISGGLGTDTLEITAQGADATFSLNSVENVNVFMISSTDIDATLWSGTQTVTLTADSTDNLGLTVTGARSGLSFVVADNASSLSVNLLDDTATGDSINVSLQTVGKSAADTTIIDVSGAAITTLNVGVSGTNYATINASATNINFSGAGALTAIVDTSDQTSALSLANYSGTASVTLTGSTLLAVTGGAGNETIKFNDASFDGDAVDGNGGTDTLNVALSGDKTANFSAVSDVENLSFRASGSTVTLDFSGLSITDTVTLTNATAAVDLSLRGMSGQDVVFATQAVALGDVTLDYVAGASGNLTLVSGGGNQFISGLNFTDGAALGVTVTGGTTFSAGSLTLENTFTNLAVELGGSADLEVKSAGITASGVTSLSINVGGSATYANAGSLVASGLSTLNLTAGGGENNSISFAGSDVALTSGALTVNASMSGGASIAGLGFTTNGQTGAAVINIAVGDSSEFGVAGDGLDYAAAGSLDFNATIGASGQAYVSALNLAGSATTLDIDVTVGASSTFVLASANTEEITGITINGAGSATVGSISASSGITGNIYASGVDLTISSIVASGIGNITLNGVGNNYTLTSVVAEQVGNVVVAGSGSTVNFDGASGIGSITIKGSGATTVDVGSATNVGTVSTINALGTAVVDLGSATGALTINLGTGYNDITVGKGGATITLTAGTGHDDLIAVGSAGSNVIEISNFQLASATDRLGFYTPGFQLALNGTASTGTETGGSMNVTLISASPSTTATPTFGSAGTVVILRSGTFTDISDVITQLKDGGTYELNASTAMAGDEGYDLMVAWTDTAGDTYVTLLNGMSAVAGEALFSASQSVEYDHIFKLNGVDIGTYSGSAFTDKFFAG